MKNTLINKKIYLKGATLSLVTATFLLSGCGSNGIDDVYERDTEVITNTDYSVQVVDDAVKGSRISANECSGYEEKGDGWYTLTGCSSKPKAIIAEGGYIDFGDTNVTMGFPLMVNGNMIKQGTSFTATPLTTLLATVNDYEELKSLQQALGFSSIDEMFTDNNSSRDLQQTLNSYFIEAKNSGVGINNFADFTKDFRSMIVQAGSDTNATETISKARTKFKEDFDANPNKYMEKYGVVFSGFVTSTDLNSTAGTKDILKNIGNKYKSEEKQVVFSGFIFDDIIGSANKDKYTEDANITIQNVNTNQFLDLNYSTETHTPLYSIKADSYGKYVLKVNLADINASNSYLLKGTIKNTTNKDILLNSILTGEELLAKFKTNLNTSDIPDLTISNVTTAKVAILEKKGIDFNNTDSVLAEKKIIETTNKETLLGVATGIKTLIDGNVSSENNNTFDYIKNNITVTNNVASFIPTTAMETQFVEFKAIINSNKTLVSQLASTTYEKFKIPEAKVLGKRLVFSVVGENNPTTIRLFKDKSFTRESKTNNLTPIFEIGTWAINDEGDLALTNIENNVISTITLDKIDLATTTYNTAGQFTGTTTNPKGSLTQGSTKQLISLTTLADIDLTKYTPPMVAFTLDNIKNKKLYEVYYDSNTGEYEDAVYIFNQLTGTTLTGARYSTDAKDETNLVDKPILINNGVLTVGTDIFKIKKAYPTKIVVSTNRTTSSSSLGEEVEELFYSAIDAAASKEIKTYNNSSYQSPVSLATGNWNKFDNESNNGTYNSIVYNVSPEKITLRTVPINNQATNYYGSKISVANTIDSNISIGTKAELAITENIGNSARQRGRISTRYEIPSFEEGMNSGQLLVDVQVRFNKVVYTLKLIDGDGTTKYDILDVPVPLVEENTYNKKYSVMTILLKNKIAIELNDGMSTYYQYIDLPTLWRSKPDQLKYYKYPTALKNATLSAYLDDDGTGKLYEGKMNTPIKMEVSKFETIRGKETSISNYEGGVSEIATVKNKDISPDNFSFNNVTLADFNITQNSNTITVSGINAPAPISITGGEYTLDGENWTSITGTVTSGQTVRVRLTTATSSGVTKTANLNIGGVVRGFSVTTKDITPNPFTLGTQTGVDLNVTRLATPVTVSGINAPTPISIIGGEYSIGSSGVWTDQNGTVENGQTINVRAISSATQNTTKTATLTIGGISSNFVITTKTLTTAQTNDTILNAQLNEQFADATYFDLWKGTDLDIYNSLVGIDPSFIMDTFGDVGYENNTYNKHLKKTLITVNPTSGAINFNESEISTIYINGTTPYTYNTSDSGSNKLTKISTGIYQIYDDTNTSAQEEIKFVREFTGAELNTLFDTVAPDTNVTFDANDKGAVITVKVLKDYYEWNEEEKNWSSTTPTTYSSLESFISTASTNQYWFVSKEGVTNTGIGFTSGYTTGQTSGTLSEYSWNGTSTPTSTPAGTWSIINDGILDLNITATGYDYTPAFTVKDGKVWRGEERKADETNIGLVYNASALTKLDDYFTNLYGEITTTPTTPVFTSAMVSGKTIYEVYFDTTDDHNTNANKSIARFTFDGNGSTTSGTFTATAIFGNNVGKTGTGIWNITADGRLETTFSGEDTTTGFNTIEATVTNGIQTSWVAGSETDINYYFYTLSDANSFGYTTTATESTNTTSTFSIPTIVYPQNTVITTLFENNTTTADVNDAKTMVANLRELNYSMYKQEDNGTESGLLVTQDDLHMNHIKSVVDNFDISINTTADAITTLTDTFSNQVETDLNTTIESIKTRLDSISAAINTQLDSNLTQITVNDGEEDFNMSVTYNSNGEVISAQAHDIIMSGTGYSTTLSSLNFGWNETLDRYTLQAMGNSSIYAQDTTFVGDIGIDSILNDSNNTTDLAPLEKLLFSLNGRVISSGRVLDGNLSIDTVNGNYKLHGKLAGLSNEPTIEGDFVANVTLANLQTINIDHEVEWVDTYNVGDYYNSGYYYPLLARDTSSIYHLIKDGTTLTTLDTNISLTSQNNGVYTPENYNFKVSVTIGGNTYQGYLETFQNNNGYITYGIQGDNYQWIYLQINTLMDSNFTVSIHEGWTQTVAPTSIPISAVSVIPEQKIDLENIPQSYMFDGNITHTTDGLTNIASLEIAINKPTASKTMNSVIQNLTFGNEKVNLQAANITLGEVVLDGNTSISETVTNSFSFSGLKGIVLDDTNTTLSLDINGSGSSKTYRTLDNDTPHQEDMLDINATYSYAGTLFNGALNFNLHDPYTDDDYYSSSLSRSVGTAKFKGMISANGFIPFDVTLEANLIDVNTTRYEAITLLLNRGTTTPYTLAAKYATQFHRAFYSDTGRYWAKDGTILDIKDNNGVVGNSFVTGEYSINSIVFKNISETTLGTAGQQTTGNSWEIQYSDNSTETIF